MGRRNENNRLAHKKKVNNQKKKQLEALAARKEKLKKHTSTICTTVAKERS